MQGAGGFFQKAAPDLACRLGRCFCRLKPAEVATSDPHPFGERKTCLQVAFLIKEVFYRYYHALDSYHRLNNTNASLYRENERLSKINDHLTDENTTLRAENKDFRLLRKVFGSQQIDALISQAKEQERQRKHTKQPSNQRTKRIRNNDFER